MISSIYGINLTKDVLFRNYNISALHQPDSYLGNRSFTEDPQIPTYIKNTAMVFCVIIMCLGVVGNVMVPVVIMKTKDMRNSTNIFLMNLSFADLMVLLICAPTVLVEVNSRPDVWLLGKEMCVLVPFVELTVAHASVLTILAISFERYYAICEPLRASYVCTKFRAICICAVAWLTAAIFTSPILAIAELQYMMYFDGSIVPVCLTQASSFWPTVYFLMIIIIFFLLPLIVLIILYYIIGKGLIKTSSKVGLNENMDTCNVKGRKQVVLMLATVVLSFFFCLLPFRLFTLWIIVSADDSVDKIGLEMYYNILYFSRIMIYLNSAINPILYNLMSSKFRSGFIKMCYGLSRPDRLKCHRTSTSHVTTSTSCQSSCMRDRRSQSLRIVYRKASSEHPTSGFDSKHLSMRSLRSNEIENKLNIPGKYEPSSCDAGHVTAQKGVIKITNDLKKESYSCFQESAKCTYCRKNHMLREFNKQKANQLPFEESPLRKRGVANCKRSKEENKRSKLNTNIYRNVKSTTKNESGHNKKGPILNGECEDVDVTTRLLNKSIIGRSTDVGFSHAVNQNCV